MVKQLAVAQPMPVQFWLGRLLSKNQNNESLAETVEILSDPVIMRNLAKSLEDMKKGRTYSIEEV